MTTVLPPAPPPPASGSTPGASNAVVANPPAEVQTLSSGQALEALVLQQLGKSQVEVQTVFGTLKLQTAYLLPKNAVVTLMVTQLSPQQLNLQIAAINGKLLPGQALPPGPAIIAQPAAQTPTPTPGNMALPAPGTQFQATLVRPALLGGRTAGGTLPITPSPSPAPGPAAGVMPLPATPGAGGAIPTPGEAPGRSATPAASSGARPATTAVTLPGPAGAAGPAPTGPGAPSGASPTAPAAAPASSGSTPPPASPSGSGNTPPAHPVPGARAREAAAPTSPATSLPAGSRFTVQVVRILPMGTTLPQPPLGQASSLAVGVTLSGTVSSHTPSGQPIVQTPAATFALATRQPLPIGTLVTLAVETLGSPAKTAPAATALASAGLSEGLTKAPGWEALGEALKELQALEAGAAANTLRAVIPQPGARITAQILFFLTALRGGDIRGWLGEVPSRILERDRPGLLNRLSGEFQAMGKLSGDHSPGDWRLALIPFWVGGEIRQVRLYQRKYRPDDEEEDDRDGQRFILDFLLSKIGQMQIDGLFKAKRNRVDLIVRTEQPLPSEAQREIAMIYTEAAELTGIGGGLAFQAAPGNFVEFPASVPGDPRPGLIV